jgi:peptidoglycan/xylan/chitin deacetylase (PgdA/CDA1 family)
MAHFRKILCIFALCAGFFVVVAGPFAAAPQAHHPRPAGDGGNLVRARLSQQGRFLTATIRTRRPVALKGLDRLPRPRSSAYLCVELRRRGRLRRLCLGGEDGAHRRVGLEVLDGAGETVVRRQVAARVRRHGARRLALAILPDAAGLAPHRYRWRLAERRSRGCEGGARHCEEALPGAGARTFRLRPVRAVGCTGAAAVLDRNGPRDAKVVALTFDDGPSSLTPAFLDVLRDKHAAATFFEVGQEMPGRGSTMRRILREGSEIGNHTMHHGFFPGHAEIAGPSALSEAYAHFRPCLFRPPGGAVDSAVISTAASLGMRTVTWDVDPSDWSNPGSGAVYSRVVGAVRPGSIVVMHDGGGDRGGTLAALPSIIDTLRSRGYRFATVSELLGGHSVYRPYG